LLEQPNRERGREPMRSRTPRRGVSIPIETDIVAAIAQLPHSCRVNRETVGRVLSNPTVWLVFLLVEWFGLGWLVLSALPGDPVTYAPWVKIVLAFAWIGGITAFNYLLRRRLIR
jgi:hypothetical protein